MKDNRYWIWMDGWYPLKGKDFDNLPRYTSKGKLEFDLIDEENRVYSVSQ